MVDAPASQAGAPSGWCGFESRPGDAAGNKTVTIMSDEVEELIRARAEARATISYLHEEVRRINTRLAEARYRAANSTEHTAAFPRGAVKSALLRALEEVGPAGLNARIAVQLAEGYGLRLERTTVSSLLSRMKRDGIVEHDGTRYRLPGRKEKRPESQSPAARYSLELCAE